MIRRMYSLVHLAQRQQIPPRADMVDTGVARGAQQKGCRVEHRGRIAPQSNHTLPYLLCQILGLLARADHLRAVDEQPLVVLPEDPDRGRVVPGQEAGKERSILGWS